MMIRRAVHLCSASQRTISLPSMPGMIMSRMITVGWKLFVRLDERAPIGRHADLVAEVLGDVLDEAAKGRLVVADQQSFVLHSQPMLRSRIALVRPAAW